MSARKPMLRGSFVKLFVGGEANHELLLPNGVEERLHPGSSRQVWLKAYGRRQWEVIVERPDNGNSVKFTRDWNAFIVDNALARNETIIFIEDKTNNYTVELYDAACGMRGLNDGPQFPADERGQSVPAFVVSILNAHCMNEHRGHPRIHSGFVARFTGLESPMILYTRRDYPSCEVHLEAIQGDLCLTSGWDKFVGDNGIKPFDRLAFRKVDDGRLWLVTVYAVGGMPRYRYIPPSGGCHLKMGQPSCTRTTVYRFVKQLQDYQTTHTYLEIPKKFVVESGIMAPFRVDLEKKEGLRWIVWIAERANNTSTRFYMMDGWSDFARSNSLGMGDYLLFSMTEVLKTVIKVVILQNGEGERLMSTADRGGYIPLYI